MRHTDGVKYIGTSVYRKPVIADIFQSRIIIPHRDTREGFAGFWYHAMSEAGVNFLLLAHHQFYWRLEHQLC